jgi:hypothetical protein
MQSLFLQPYLQRNPGTYQVASPSPTELIAQNHLLTEQSHHQTSLNSKPRVDRNFQTGMAFHFQHSALRSRPGQNQRHRSNTQAAVLFPSTINANKARLEAGNNSLPDTHSNSIAYNRFKTALELNRINTISL